MNNEEIIVRLEAVAESLAESAERFDASVRSIEQITSDATHNFGHNIDRFAAAARSIPNHITTS